MLIQPSKITFEYLDMSKLSNLDAGAGNGNRATGFQTVEEPLFNRVVVQGSIDIYWPY